MVPELHNALARLLWERGRISPLEVDVRFEAPTREFIDRLLRPTVNFFLFDVEENTDLRVGSFQPATKANGHAERRAPPRRIDLRYMVSALTTEIEDEHRLLWRTLETLLRHPELPRELLPEELRETEPPLVARTVQQDEGRRPLDLWSALGAAPRPSLYYVVTAPVDLDMVITAPLVLTRTVRFGRGAASAGDTGGARPDGEADVEIGGVVRGPDGAALAGVGVALAETPGRISVTNGDGEFRLAGVPTGSVRLRLEPPGGPERTVSIAVPAGSYDVVLD